MKLVEIKNNLAKLQYDPVDFPIVLSEFLTVDDGNQKIIAQVVSIESTKDDETNCAVLKFALDLNSDNTFCVYSGYVPTLDSLVSKTKSQIVQDIFSDSTSGVCFGQLTSDSALKLSINPSIMDNFLYIQSDRPDDSNTLVKKFFDLNDSLDKKSLYIDFDGLFYHPDAEKLVFGRDFKLPIDNCVLNYIYEHDLTGLTLEQKTIVQDIILEIQDYIESLDSGYIPFDTLLDVVNDIYETDKSTGIILLRNKLLKYKQLNIFASKDSEILSLSNSIERNNLTVLSLNKIDANWQREVLDFVTLNLDEVSCYLMFNVKEDAFSKEILANIFRAKNLYPVIISKYDSEFAPVLKSYARNLVLFKPQTQQKSFATYNSFFNKLSDKEFIISGESTFYTPLIFREIPKEITLVTHISSKITENVDVVGSSATNQNDELLSDASVSATNEVKIETIDEIQEILDDEVDAISEDVVECNESDSITDDFKLEASDHFIVQEVDEVNDFDDVKEVSLEQEIAKDVDKMFFAEAAINEDDFDVEVIDSEEELEVADILDDMPNEGIDYNKMFTDEDLDLLDENILSDDSVQVIEEPSDLQDDIIDIDDENLENEVYSIAEETDDVELCEEIKTISSNMSTNNIDNLLYDTSVVDNFPTVDEPVDEMPEVTFDDTKGSLLTESEVPVYKTEIEVLAENNSAKIAEGNIVFHQKYGRGIVEQMVNYGNKTFCSILFDNVGRRLLDPNLAGLKQM